MADFDLPEKNFSMVFIAVRSFMHLFTQESQIKCLNCIHRHLRPGGLLIMDLYTPNFKRLCRSPEEEYVVHRKFNLLNGNHVIHKRRFLGVDVVNQINYEDIRFEEYDKEGRLVRTKDAYMYTRFTFRYELQLLLEKTGFTVNVFYRDYDGNPYDGTGEMIAVASRL
jgi:SAM-dependent methyltransferase